MVHIGNFLKNKTTNERFAAGKTTGSTVTSSMLSAVDEESADMRTSLVTSHGLSTDRRKGGYMQNCRDMCFYKPKAQEEIFEDYSIRVTRFTQNNR